jgi:hypothetical protein
MLDKKLAKLRDAAGDGGRYDNAANLFRQLVEALNFPEFLTLAAYDLITADVALSLVWNESRNFRKLFVIPAKATRKRESRAPGPQR